MGNKGSLSSVKLFSSERFRIALVVVLASSVLAGCEHKTSSPQEQSVPELYFRTVDCLKAYADSMAKAPDSAAVYRLMADMQSALTKLNFKFPANTDLELTEDENDTIYLMTKHILDEKNKRLETFARRDTVSKEETDSLLSPEALTLRK